MTAGREVYWRKDGVEIVWSVSDDETSAEAQMGALRLVVQEVVAIGYAWRVFWMKEGSFPTPTPIELRYDVAKGVITAAMNEAATWAVARLDALAAWFSVKPPTIARRHPSPRRALGRRQRLHDRLRWSA